MATSQLTLISPGNLVVPLSAVVDILDGQISTAALNALVLTLSGTQSREVRPGDLISSKLINEMLRDIGELNRRLLLLETAAPSTDEKVQIIEPGPTKALRIGDPLIIRGRGLSANSMITIAGQPVGGAESSKNDTQLTVRSIPPLDIQGGLPAAGKSVLLQVSNESGSDSTSFVLKPYQLSKPIGNMTIAISGKPAPGTQFKAKGSYIYTFRVRSDTRPDWKFDITPKISAANWTAVASRSDIFLPAAVDNKPTIAEFTVTVTIPDGANAGDVGELSVALAAIGAEDFSWRSTPVEKIVVDSTSAPLQKLNLGLSDATAGDAEVRKRADNSRYAVIGPGQGQGGIGQIQFDVTRVNGALDPGDYQVDLAKLKAFTGDSVSQKWTASIPGSPTGKVTLAGTADPLLVLVTVQPGAPKAQLQLVLTYLADSKTFGSGSFDVEIQT